MRRSLHLAQSVASAAARRMHRHRPSTSAADAFVQNLLHPVGVMRSVHPAAFAREPSVDAPIDVRWWCRELNIGAEALLAYRAAVAQRCVMTSTPEAPAPHDATADIRRRLHRAVASLGVVLLPQLVSLRPFSYTAAGRYGGAATGASVADVVGHALVAESGLRAGQFIASVPASAILRAAPPQSAPGQHSLPEEGVDALVIEDLASRVLLSLVDQESRWRPYAVLLKELAMVPANAPFLDSKALRCPEARSMAASVQRLIDQPRSAVLLACDHAHRQWAVSTVLSRRLSGDMLCPVVDWTDHDAECNSAYTMPSSSVAACGQQEQDEGQLIGMDVVDNLFAGVPLPRLLDPHLHLFALRGIRAGERITTTYCDASIGELGDDVGPPVATAAGNNADVWRCQWGFVPRQRTVTTVAVTRQLTAVVVKRRFHERRTIFPCAAADIMGTVEHTTTTT